MLNLHSLPPVLNLELELWPGESRSEALELPFVFPFQHSESKARIPASVESLVLHVPIPADYRLNCPRNATLQSGRVAEGGRIVERVTVGIQLLRAAGRPHAGVSHQRRRRSRQQRQARPPVLRRQRQAGQVQRIGAEEAPQRRIVVTGACNRDRIRRRTRPDFSSWTLPEPISESRPCRVKMSLTQR